jgi:hypothetical protein
MTKFKTYTHIIRPRADGRSNCYDDPLCGFRPGCAYVTLGPDQQIPDIPDTLFPMCSTCAGKHIEEHYARVGSLAERFSG